MLITPCSALVASAPPIRAERLHSRNASMRCHRSSPGVLQNCGHVSAAACNEPHPYFSLERKETIPDCRVNPQFAHLTHYCHDGRRNSLREAKTTEVHRSSSP